MPHCKPEDFDSTLDRWPHIPWRCVTWGDMEVSYSQPAAMDCTDALRGGKVAGGVCSCPHYGFLFEGRIRCVYPDTDMPDDVVTAGEAYFFPAGHIVIFEEPSKALDFNPGDALRRVMDALERSAAQKHLAERAP